MWLGRIKGHKFKQNRRDGVANLFWSLQRIGLNSMRILEIAELSPRLTRNSFVELRVLVATRPGEPALSYIVEVVVAHPPYSELELVLHMGFYDILETRRR